MTHTEVRFGLPARIAVVPLVLWEVWTVVATFRSDWGWASAAPYLLCPLVLVMGVLAGGWLQRRADSPALPVALLVVGIALVLGVILVVEPGKAPTGYPNANAALAVQTLALCGLALLAMPARRRGLVVLSAALAVGAVALNRSAAGAAVVGPLAVVVLFAVTVRPRSRWWAALGVLTSLGVTIAAARVIIEYARGNALPQWAVGPVDPVREQLWHDAFALWQRQPLSGSGPGSFADATSLSSDPDTMAAHSSVLQIGAETGWIGVALAGLIALTCLLWAGRGGGAESLIAAGAVTALVVHSYVDHLLEFEAVVVVAGLVVGWAGSSGNAASREGSEQFDVTQRERPLAS